MFGLDLRVQYITNWFRVNAPFPTAVVDKLYGLHFI